MGMRPDSYRDAATSGEDATNSKISAQSSVPIAAITFDLAGEPQ